MTGRARRRIRKAMTVAYVACLSVLFVGLNIELSGMRGAEWAATALVTLALMFGFTSALYARSRAFNSGRIQRRTLYAADRALRAIVFYLLAIALISVIHFVLVSSGYTPEPRRLDSPTPMHLAPMLLFFPCLLLVLAAYANFFDALRTVSFRFLILITARKFVRQVKYDA